MILLLTGLLAAWGALYVIEHLPREANASTVVIRTQEVQSLSIDGAGVPVAQLRSAMETKIGTTVDTATLERDRETLEATLQARGYLAANVAPPIVTYGPNGGAYIVFSVERGRLFHLGSVTLEGPSWKDAGVVTLAEGDEALSERLVHARRAAEATLARHGKPLRVELVLHPDHAEATLDVTLVTR